MTNLGRKYTSFIKDKAIELFYKQGLYDLTIGIDSLESGATEGWEVSAPKTVQVDGSIVGVLGNYNTGKTFVLERITKTKLVDVDEKKSLQFKFFQATALDKKDYTNILLDTGGTSKPVLVSGDKGNPFSRKTQYDDFLKDLIVELSDYVLYVVGDISWKDQELIINLARQRIKKRNERFSEVWVIHNLKNFTSTQMLEKKQAEIVKLFGAVPIQSKTEKYWYCKSYKTRHMFLMDDAYGSQENAFVFNMLRNWITSSYYKKRAEVNMVDYCVTSMRNVLTRSPGIPGGPNSVRYQNGRLFLEREIVQSYQSLNLWTPFYNLRYTDQGCYITLYCPNMPLENLIVQPVDDEMVGHFTLEITGDLPLATENYIYDDCLSGTFQLRLNIPSAYMTSDPPVTESNNGIVTIFYKVKPMTNTNIVTLEEFRCDMQDIQFDVKTPLGSGGNGQVFHGKWRWKDVAVKKIVKDKTNFDTLNEVLLLLKFKSEYVVHCWGWAEDENAYYILLELMDTDLSSYIEQNKGKIPWKLKLQLIRKIAVAMEFLHRESLMHRDLKSKNVLLKEVNGSMEVKLADFDLSVEGNTDDIQLNIQQVGTLAYMAPEIIAGGIYGFPADVYAFGMVVYEILEEVFPFESFASPENIAYEVVINGVRPEISKVISGEYEKSYEILDEIITLSWKHEVEERPTWKSILEKLDAMVLTVEKTPSK
jgi:tRNA A-37 threonylcarbamoyl transferase component Bud32